MQLAFTSMAQNLNMEQIQEGGKEPLGQRTCPSDFVLCFG